MDLPTEILYGAGATLGAIIAGIEARRAAAKSDDKAGGPARRETIEIDWPGSTVVRQRTALIKAPDALTALTLLGLAPFAWLVPRHAWGRLTRALSWLHIKLRGSHAHLLEAAFPALATTASVGELEHAYLAGTYEEILLTLREQLSRDWQAEICLRGEEHIRMALANGRGAVLWTFSCTFGGLVSKIALRSAGFPVVNLRSFVHPYSNSLFGRAVLNRIRNRIEDRYLRDSVILVDGDEANALQKLEAYLDQNVPVAIAASGSKPLELPFLGGTLRLALGAPTLAALKAAPLLPTFTVPNANGGFDLVIEPPIQVPADAPLRDKAEDIGRSYAHVLETYVIQYPMVWRGWFAPATWSPSAPPQ